MGREDPDFESSGKKTNLLIESLAEEVPTIASKEPEFEYHDKSYQFSFFLSFCAQQTFFVINQKHFLAIKLLLTSIKKLSETRMEGMPQVILEIIDLIL